MLPGNESRRVGGSREALPSGVAEASPRAVAGAHLAGRRQRLGDRLHRPAAGPRGTLPVSLGGARPGERPPVTVATGRGSHGYRCSRCVGGTLRRTRCSAGREERQRLTVHQRAVVEELLAEHDVVALFSPPYWPRYNGSVEAGIGSLKDRTEGWAARAGRAGSWTWDDAAGACAEANTLSRPRSASGASPDELWSTRKAITPEERAAFGSAVAEARRTQEAAAESCAEGEAVVRSQREMAREAIRLALEQCGYLHYKRRTIPPPL